MMLPMIKMMMDESHSATWESGPPFWMRQLWDTVLKLLVEKVPDRDVEFPDYFDNIHGPLAVKYREPFYTYGTKKLKFKGYSRPLKPEDKVGLCLHQTGVNFGTSRRRRAFWRKVIDNDAETVIAHGFVIPEDEEGKQKLAERIALHERFWKVPYHFVALANGDILYNNDVRSYTWHGNKANRSTLGVAVVGHFPGLEKNRKSSHTEVDDFFLATMRACMRLAMLKSREEGCLVEDLTAHRVYSARRTNDPGEYIWKHVAIPAMDAYNLSVSYDRKVGSGREIPNLWDKNSPYNWYGKKVG